MQRRKIDIKLCIMHRLAVRTTLTLYDDIFDLVRRGLQAQTQSRDEGNLVDFELPEDSLKVSAKDVRRIESEGV